MQKKIFEECWQSSSHWKILRKSMETLNYLVTNILQNIFLCVPQMKDSQVWNNTWGWINYIFELTSSFKSSKWMLHTGGGWGVTPYMIVKRFGCIAIHNKALYKCIIHSFKITDWRIFSYTSLIWPFRSSLYMVYFIPKHLSSHRPSLRV